ncbi:C40 family peptidase [Streptacidiphilus neutrinimicus]|uniref:C40 family peptidase n=1 Tax=Streptacidiphilus neutrinimicus TaxID=105420 RepID=UPI00069332AB|nr:C40 family peptidase [Streptacidiphilus neutrinimicus]
MTAFAELDLDTAVCACAYCGDRRRTTEAASPGGAARERRAPGRPLFRAAATTAMLAVGGSAALIAAPAASAEPALAHAGWDGHRYWFRAEGEWRWTTHYAVYLRHVGSGGDSGGASATGGIRQGWDGERYWFRKNGEWRWTTHYAIYLKYAGHGHPVPGPGPGDPNPDPSPSPNPSPVPTPGPTPGPVTAGIEAAIGFAEAQLGKPYVWGGDGPYGYDCSGLVQQAFFRAGIKLPRVAADQYRATTPVAPGRLRRGDLIFWSSSSRSSGIHHVAIYLGGGRYIEAPHRGADVRISVLSSGYYPDFFGRVS